MNGSLNIHIVFKDNSDFLLYFSDVASLNIKYNNRSLQPDNNHKYNNIYKIIDSFQCIILYF